jgi:exonuclease III
MKLGCELFKNRRYFVPVLKHDFILLLGLCFRPNPLIFFYWQEHDGEGRLITAEFPTFYLLSVYVPNAGRGLVTLDKRKEPLLV